VPLLAHLTKFMLVRHRDGLLASIRDILALLAQANLLSLGSKSDYSYGQPKYLLSL